MKVLSILYAVLLVATVVHAAKTDYWIEGVGKGVYQRCEGNDLAINQPYFFASTNESLTKITWPYPREQVISLVNAIADGEPYDNYFQGCANKEAGGVIRNHDGCNIISCGNNSLDVVLVTYYWNGEVINQPSERPVRNETNSTTNTTTTVPEPTAPLDSVLLRKASAIGLAFLALAVVVYVFTRGKKTPKGKKRKR